jgi:hypothetical protein
MDFFSFREKSAGCSHSPILCSWIFSFNRAHVAWAAKIIAGGDSHKMTFGGANPRALYSLATAVRSCSLSISSVLKPIDFHFRTYDPIRADCRTVSRGVLKEESS